jgi:hypothetical protein
MAIQFLDIAGRREFPIPGMARYVLFSDIILYTGVPGTHTGRVKVQTKSKFRLDIQYLKISYIAECS